MNIQHHIQKPTLRFPEFHKIWSDRKFDSFLDLDLRAVPKPDKTYLALGIRSHGRGIFQKPESDPSKIAMDTLYVVRENDLVVNITFAWEGAIAIAKPEDDGGLVSHRFPTYVFKREEAIHEFFEYIIESPRFRHKLDLISPGGAGRNRVLSKPAFLKLEHPIPSVDEQERIAVFLGAVDEKIDQLEEKVELLESYKSGCMQQLFTQKTRFKDSQGRDYPDWSEKPLDKIVSFSKGKGVSKKDISENGLQPCIRYGEIYTTYKERIQKVHSRTNVAAADLVFSEAGDVIIPASGEDALDMARACCVEMEGIALGGDINILRGAESGVFLAYYLNNAKKNDIARVAQGISVVHLYASQLKGLSIALPHPDEQAKIAEFLMDIDKKISMVSQELELAQTFKKGLLQQMFV